MSKQSCSMNTPSILFCFCVPGCGLYFVLLFPFPPIFQKIKMAVLKWTSVCSCDLPHKIDRTLHDPTNTSEVNEGTAPVPTTDNFGLISVSGPL